MSLTSRAISMMTRPGPAREDVCRICKNERRCTVIRVLRDRCSVTKHELTDVIAEQEFGSNYSSKERKRVIIALHQVHLPTLDDAGVVKFGDVVEPGPDFDAYSSVLNTLEVICSE